ncbi:MAG: hypothetical protein HOW73_43120 [Polyangiaceae bacterium]|nr:hypothetical protein [Polyangiaceae bacterium]
MTTPIAPNRMTLTNLRTAETREPQFNPDKVEEEIQANYAALSALGYSHKPLQYTNTENVKLSFDFHFDSTTSYGGGGGGAFAHETRKFLLSVMVPPGATAQDVLTGGTDRCLFVWPEMWAFQCHILKLRSSFTRFARTGKATAWVCNVEIGYVSDFRLTSEDVRLRGFLGG